nr:DUF982 domain-containing protein [Sinorhizobium fredii]
MHCFWWDKSVELELGETGGYRSVKSTREAVECLLSRWPQRDGRALAAAKRTCLQALDARSRPRKPAGPSSRRRRRHTYRFAANRDTAKASNLRCAS